MDAEKIQSITKSVIDDLIFNVNPYYKKKVVLTNGCFDILHRGHIECLNFAKEQGDILIVAVNDDDGVKALGKGPNRPIFKLEDRMFMLQNLKAVDYVVPFHGTEATECFKALANCIDVYVKGGDYDMSKLNKSEVAALTLFHCGPQPIEFKFFKFQTFTSTTDILKKLQ